METPSSVTPATRLPPALGDIRAAQRSIEGHALRTPVVPLGLTETPAETYLKLENLQPTGSFKIRGAVNAISQIDRRDLEAGVWTASGGNMAQALAWSARQQSVACTVVVPETIPEVKLNAIRRLGAVIVTVSRNELIEILTSRRKAGMTGTFVHPFIDPQVIAANGTIGLEILEDLPQVDTVLVAYGGGALSCGIACAIKAAAPTVRVIACEPSSEAPLHHTLRARRSEDRPSPAASIGAGGLRVYRELYHLAQQVLSDAVAVPDEGVSRVVRMLVERNHIASERVGALPVAAALEGLGGHGRVCCVVSEGNIECSTLARILQGDVLSWRETL